MLDYIIRKLGNSFILDLSNIIPHPIKLRTKISVQCQCGNWNMVTIDYLYRRKLKNQPYRCISCGVKSTVSKHDNRKKQSSRSRKMWQDPLYREMIKQSAKILWMDPYYRNKVQKHRKHT